MIKSVTRRVVGEEIYLSLHEMRVRIRYWWRLMIGADPRFSKDCFVPIEAHGEWHLCPIGLNPSSIVYSLGIGKDITFDMSVISRFGARIHAFDPTPTAMAWLSEQILPPHFNALPLGIAAYDGTAVFSPPDDPVNPSYAFHGRSGEGIISGATVVCEVRRLSTLMRELGHSQIDLLKMDIEGAEYEVIQDLTEAGVSVKQLLVEFHHRKPGIGPKKTCQAVAQLRRAGFKLFHISSSGQEMAFIRNNIEG